MKLTAEQDIKMMITSTTQRSKEDIIRHTITKAKIIVLKEINDEYNALLENIMMYDTTEEDLDNKTKIAIEVMDMAKLTGDEIQKIMTGIINQYRQVAKDIVISRASIMQAHQRKVELDQLVTTTTNNEMNLEKDTKTFKNVIKTATVTSKDKAMMQRHTC